MYLPNSQDFNLSDIQYIKNQFPTLYILLEDSNSHSPLWDCSNLDSRLTLIEQKFYSSNYLKILNNGQGTRVNYCKHWISFNHRPFIHIICNYFLYRLGCHTRNIDYFPVAITLKFTNS